MGGDNSTFAKIPPYIFNNGFPSSVEHDFLCQVPAGITLVRAIRSSKI